MKAPVVVVLALCFAFSLADPHGHHHNGGGHPGFNPLIRVCRDDVMKFCPNLQPESLKDLFESECCKTHEDELQPACKKLMEDFRTNGGETSIPVNHPMPANPPVETGTSGSTGAVGTPLYETCHADYVRFCPEIAQPFTESTLFEASCFQKNLHSVTPACKTLYEKFVINRHFVIGLFISGGMMVMASALLSLLTVCCCVACCVRVCMKRRRAQRICKHSLNADTELGVATTKSINNEQEEQLPQTQFVFPNQQVPIQSVFSPYSGHPQYIQPVFTVVQQ